MRELIKMADKKSKKNKDEKDIHVWNTYTTAEKKRAHALADDYRNFISKCKTERESVSETIRMAKAAGYIELSEAIRKKKKLKTGDKVYAVGMKKTVALFQIGERPCEDGLAILGAHIDTCKLDLKQNPLYEEGNMAYLDTHYYGGIKKYQWVTIPLALHGVVAKKDGTIVNVLIGEDDNDPVFGISDLLIHLSAEQLQKKAAEAIGGEELNVIIGGLPLKDEEKEPVKANMLKILKEKYDIEEEDFLSAEIEVVPAGKSRELGLDRSMILGYGHDDRVCAFAQIKAMLDIKTTPDATCCCILADKEEIGSVGATGMHAKYFENTIAEIMNLTGEYSELKLRRALTNSHMLSCDVIAGFDPNFAGVFEKKNSAFLGMGVCFNKYTGARGKSGSNDANAEYMAKLRKWMDDGKVRYQTAELGKVDAGGGGTIAYICAEYGMEVIDSGVAVLSMHAPWEIISKADLYEAFKAYRAFLLKAE